jgi:hypothetical protein
MNTMKNSDALKVCSSNIYVIDNKDDDFTAFNILLNDKTAVDMYW